MRCRRGSIIAYLAMAAALLTPGHPCAPTQMVASPTTTMGTLSCTSANVPNINTGLTNPLSATAGAGQSVTLSCNTQAAVTAGLVFFGDNTADQETTASCVGPCVTSTLILTCDGTTGRFTFIPTTGPDAGKSVALGSFSCN